jgi:hypothetical protein
MIRSGWLTLALLAVALASAADAELAPKDFAYGMPITVPAPAAAYRIAIPLDVYQKIVHENLSDLRVFNAGGEVVPYGFQQPHAEPAALPPESPLPLFPLRGDAHAALDGVRVTIQSPGSAVHVQAGAAAAGSQTVNGYVLDARELTAPVAALTLHWPDGAPEFSGSIRVESSDELGSWRLVRNDAPVVNLRTEEARLVEGHLDLPATKAKFWRLTWLGKSAPFDLTAVTAELAADRPDAERSSLTIVGTPLNDRRQEFAFDLGARLPVSELNIELPQSNSVAKIQLLSRARSADEWRPITHGEFYRVQAGDSERRNAAMPIPADPDRYWLARLDQPGSPLGEGALKLQAIWNAQDVVFLAQGSGPYLLVYGNGALIAANPSLSTVPNGVTILRAQLGAPKSLGGSARIMPPRALFPWKLAILWAVLGLGVVLLAWMVYRLSRELRRPG